MAARTLQVTLPDDIADEIEQAVRDGEYVSTDDALRAAAEQWQANRLVEELGVDCLQRAWEEGLASGPPGDWNFKQFMNDLHAWADAKKA